MLVALPVLNDNYIWLYARDNLPVIVIDIAKSEELFFALQQYQLEVEAVLLTHEHDDHTAGVTAFKQRYPQVPIFGSGETQKKGATQLVYEGKIQTPHYHIQVVPTGGHTAEHLSFVLDNHLFCGDSLFSAGCGRVFTGNYAQMFQSLQRLKSLPDHTLVCAGHEYSLSNLHFALAVAETEFAPQLQKSAVQNQLEKVQLLRQQGKPSLPTTLALEKKINPFLQTENLEQFIRLRQYKDIF